MSGLLILLVSFVVLLAAYFTYGRFLERKWGIDEKAPTPAHTMRDGVDYVPTGASVVFGHEFASVAGAGPINGPIIAAMFGWVPVILWILLGGIFFGAVQDFAALYASVKSKGKTIGYLIEIYIGKTGKRLFMLFVWLFSILVIAAFADIVAATFNGFMPDDGLNSANASVASTSIFFMLAALLLGYFIFRVKPGGLASGAAAIALLALCITLGLNFPLHLSKELWRYLVFIYIFIASITPVWILLQPRDYLNSFLLILMMLGAFVGVIFANPTMHIAPFNGFQVNGQYLFPMLFVTIACGAISGFHSLVASGTASKQISNERDMLPVGFGSMLLECLLAVLALVAVGSLAIGGKMPEGSPPVVFASAIAGFLTQLGLPQGTVYTLITLSVSAFALTSLDSVARVGRMAFQELFMDNDPDDEENREKSADLPGSAALAANGQPDEQTGCPSDAQTNSLADGQENWQVSSLANSLTDGQANNPAKIRPDNRMNNLTADKRPASRGLFASLCGNRYLATAITLLMGYLLALRGYKDIWALFGAANQLLAALALIACAVFLKKTKRSGSMLYFPMAAMLLVTFTALGLTIYSLLQKLSGSEFNPLSDGLQLSFAVLLLFLGVMVAALSVRKLRGKT